MSFLSDLIDWNLFAGKDMFRQARDNPEQILLGAADPLGAKLWSGITGKDYEPIITQLGGATEDTFQRAEQSGIDTTAGRQAQGVADTVASIYAGNYFGGKLGGGSTGGEGMNGFFNLDNLQNFLNIAQLFGGGGSRQQPQAPPLPRSEFKGTANNPYSLTRSLTPLDTKAQRPQVPLFGNITAPTEYTLLRNIKPDTTQLDKIESNLKSSTAATKQQQTQAKPKTTGQKLKDSLSSPQVIAAIAALAQGTPYQPLPAPNLPTSRFGGFSANPYRR